MDYTLGQILIFAFPHGRPLRGLMSCEGQVLPIQEYAALFSVIGTNYGGDGRRTFHLPDMRELMPMAKVQDNPESYYICVEGYLPQYV